MIEGKDVELENIEEKTTKVVEKVSGDVERTKKRKRTADAPRLVQQTKKAVPEDLGPSSQDSHPIHDAIRSL